MRTNCEDRTLQSNIAHTNKVTDLCEGIALQALALAQVIRDLTGGGIMEQTQGLLLTQTEPTIRL